MSIRQPIRDGYRFPRRTSITTSLYLAPCLSLSKQLQATAVLAHLADLAHNADGALVLGVVLGSIKSTLLERCAAVDGCVTGSADLELSELVEFDLYCVMRIALALSLGPLGL